MAHQLPDEPVSSCRYCGMEILDIEANCSTCGALPSWLVTTLSTMVVLKRRVQLQDLNPLQSGTRSQCGGQRTDWIQDSKLTLADGGCTLSWEGTDRYGDILRRAFPTLVREADSHSQLQRETQVKFKLLSRSEEDAVLTICERFRYHILLCNTLDEAFALDFHFHRDDGRTTIGILVNSAKPYEQDSSWPRWKQVRAKQLAEIMANFVSTHPTYNRASIVIPVPPRPDKVHDLPTLLSTELAGLTGQNIGDSGSIRWTRAVERLKDASKGRDEIRGALVADHDTFHRATVLIVDDLYRSGSTIEEVCRAVKEAGADLVLGLVGSKTLRN